MSRAQQGQVFQTGTTNAATDNANANQEFGTAAGAINKQLQNPGFDPRTSAAIVSSGQEANNAAFDSLAQTAADRAARTRNDSGLTASADDLASRKAQGAADAAMKAQTTIGSAALTGEQKATEEASKLFGTAGGLGAENLATAGKAAETPSWTDQFGTDLAAGLIPSYQKGGFKI